MKEDKKTFFKNWKNLLKTKVSIEPVYTPQAPEPIGPYSQALFVSGNGQWLVCSGQIPVDPKTSQMVGSSVEEQTERVFKNIQAVLSAAKMDLKNVVKTTVFLKDMASFNSFNEVYSSYFKNHKPTRSCVEVSALPKDALVEMEVWAVCHK